MARMKGLEVVRANLATKPVRLQPLAGLSVGLVHPRVMFSVELISLDPLKPIAGRLIGLCEGS